MASGIPAVVLAAGASSRLGQPKALVEWDGETLVGRAVRLLKEASCKSITVVTRSELQVDVMLSCPDANVVINPLPEDGRVGSLQVGILSLIGDKGKIPRRILMVPVDRCGWEVSTVKTLLEYNVNTSPNPSGHPLLLCEVEKILTLPKDASLRDEIEIERVEAAGIHLNIDLPSDLEALQ